MLILIALFLTLIPAVAILYPFLRGPGRADLREEENSPRAELSRRWDTALAGLRNTELERALGNLAEEDYEWLRDQYMTEAALVMKVMELEEGQERELKSAIQCEAQQVRLRVLGQGGAPFVTCPRCSASIEQGTTECPGCGETLAAGELEATPDVDPSREVIGE